MKKRIVLCADDYGQAPTISRAIISLIKFGRISATSCMVTTPYWSDHAKWLQPLKSFVYMGLHVNFTHGEPLSQAFKERYGNTFPSLPWLILRAHLRLLDQSVLMAEIEAQIDQFTASLDEIPSFIDGHQHVHQLPVIRDALIAVYKKRFLIESPSVRLVKPDLSFKDLWRNPKKIILTLVASPFIFAKRLIDNQIPHNTCFRGIYPFEQALRYRQWMLSFLESCEDGTLIMCHPGLGQSGAHGDGLGSFRHLEYQYLFGNQFLQDCYASGVTLVPRITLSEEEPDMG